MVFILQLFLLNLHVNVAKNALSGIQSGNDKRNNMALVCPNNNVNNREAWTPITTSNN
jgi:hypothetical protein